MLTELTQIGRGLQDSSAVDRRGFAGALRDSTWRSESPSWIAAYVIR